MCIKCCFHAAMISTKSCTPRIMNWYQLIQFHYSLKSLSLLFALLILSVHCFHYSFCPWVQVSEQGISTALHWQINSRRASINRHKDKDVICHKNMKICRAEVNILKIRDYCREYPVIPANINHLLLLYEPIDKTSYAYGLQGSTANRAAVNFQSYRRKKGFISTTFLIHVFFTLLAITLA